MHYSIPIAVCFALVFVAIPRAEEVRYVTENGVTYRETREVERRPKAETRFEERTETVYKTEFVTEVQERTQLVWVPITEYAYEPRWQNWWNPFGQPTVAYQWRPVTRWEPRTQTQRMPVTVARTVPETKIVKAPVRTLGFAEQEFVQRVVVKDPPPTSNIARPNLSPSAPLRR